MSQKHSEARFASFYFISFPLPPLPTSLSHSFILSLYFISVPLLGPETKGSSGKSALHSARLRGSQCARLAAVTPAWHRADWPEDWPPDLSGQGSPAVLALCPPLLWLGSRQSAVAGFVYFGKAALL